MMLFDIKVKFIQVSALFNLNVIKIKLFILFKISNKTYFIY